MPSISFKKEKLLQKINLCSAAQTYRRGSHRIKCQWLVKHVWMISEGSGRGRRWRCFQTTCDLLHIRNSFMKEKRSWQCRRRERQKERGRGRVCRLPDISHSNWITMGLNHLNRHTGISFIIALHYSCHWMATDGCRSVFSLQLKEGVFL